MKATTLYFQKQIPRIFLRKNSAIDLLVQEHKNIQAQNKLNSMLKSNNEVEKVEEKKKSSNYKINSDKDIDKLKLESKKSEEIITSPKKKLMNNFVNDNPK